ncbi:MAG: MBL fold metallo-hydrolase [Chloroflexi bacterium]|nr:MBL fold metallo-hydrolase [Chloroflexota bacterium]
MGTVYTGERWSIQRFVSGFGNNAFLITCTRTRKSVIIDTPADPFELIEAVRQTSVHAVLITHGHRDHVEGLEPVLAEFAVPVGIGYADRASLPVSLPSDRLINITAGDTMPAILNAGNIALRPMPTPGHTPGSTCFMLESAQFAGRGTEISHVFTGDTLFPGGPGKSSSHEALRQIINSLESQIFNLPESTVVLPGHGEFTTIGQSKREYSIFSKKKLDPDLFGDVTWA